MISATGVSVVVQVLAFLRQVLVAAFFGISRELDIYVIVNSVATIAIFTFGSIFDSVTVPHLLRKREKDGYEAALSLARSIFIVSIILGVLASLLMLFVMPFLSSIIAAGFSGAERAEMVRVCWYFVPWTLLCLPYYAASAWHKSQWRFNRVFAAEISIVAVSIGSLAIWHDGIGALPLAYAAGYGAGLLQLLIGSGLWRWKRIQPFSALRNVLRNIGEMYLANQTGGLTTIVDRHVQSFVPAGGLAAVNYSNLLVNSIASLLSFREIYIVPLTAAGDRSERLERLVSGLLLMSIPLAGLLICFAPDIVRVLFERGKFNAAATVLTSEILRINGLVLVVSAINSPLARMFPILDRINFTHVMYLTVALSLGIFGYIFVGLLDLGVRGVACMQLTASSVSAAMVAYLVTRCGIGIRWSRILGHVSFSLAAVIPAGVLALLAASVFDNAWFRLVVGGAMYGFVILAVYFAARARLRGIIFGSAPSSS